MLNETIELEALRQKIEDAEFEAGSQSDYIDYGKPNEQQKQKAHEIIVQMMRKSEEVKLQLRERIATVRRDNPQAFEEWVKVHKQFLEKIITENGSGARINLAKATLNKWNKVAAGELEYVGINWHFLKDYKADVRKAFKKNPLLFWK